MQGAAEGGISIVNNFQLIAKLVKNEM